MSEKIPFNKPFIAGMELYHIAQAVTLGNIGADGHFTKKCAEFFEKRFQIPKVLMTPSCTASLEMTANLLDLKPGDEVILPSFTFVSTANAYARFGAKPVFCEIRKDNLNLDEKQLEKLITKKTKAIVPVHYAGVPCEMATLMEIANRHGLVVIEDAAQAVDSNYFGRAAGSIGHFGTYSFHETKNFICGEGGALCINDPKYIERAEIIRDKGTNRSQFLRGQVDKYTWVDMGSSYVPSEINCAYLWGQLEIMDKITQKRREIFDNYAKLLAPLETRGDLQCIKHSEGSNSHLFYILLPTAELRNQLMNALKAKDIHAVFHYVPLHSSPMGQTFGYRKGDLPITEDLSSRLLRLPFYYELTQANQERIAKEIEAFLKTKRRPSAITRPELSA